MKGAVHGIWKAAGPESGESMGLAAMGTTDGGAEYKNTADRKTEIILNNSKLANRGKSRDAKPQGLRRFLKLK